MIGTIETYGPGNGIDRVHVDDNPMPKDDVRENEADAVAEPALT